MEPEMSVMAESQAAICSVFANPKRVMILWSLVEQEKSVTEIAQVIGASLQSTSQHLHLMKEIGILDSRRDAQTIYYRVAENKVADMCRLLIEARQKEFERETPT
jgi:DNA-binding transcriptional ArsR family regulator